MIASNSYVIAHIEIRGKSSVIAIIKRIKPFLFMKGEKLFVIVENYLIEFSSKGRIDIFDLSSYLADIMSKTKVKNGQMHLFAIGSTTGLTTIEYEPGLIKDIKEFYSRLIPYGPDYHHHNTWHDDNGSSHLQSALLKTNLSIPVDKGNLVLGTWQQVIFIDFDTRPRKRQVHCQIMGLDS